VDINELRSIDLQNIGGASPAVKAILIGFVCVLIVAAWVYVWSRPQYEELKKVQAEEEELRSTFELKQRRAANLDAYRLQLEEMNRSFGTMLRQLPSKTEVESLLVDVSQTALASGLEIELFKPEGEVSKGFYAELPIRLKVRGRFHAFGTFASGVAALPRIVTLHDIVLSPGKEPGDPMTMEATAKTYRYLEEEAG
jgi:type IV pilus assembly protein PilO